MSSETSTPYTPASTSTTVAGNETVSLADEIKKYDTAKLIEFLKGQEDLGLSESALKILENEETKKDLKEVLAKYGVQDGRITDIPQFTPKPHNIDDKNEALIRSECYTMRKCFTN
ncbi:uncharacterized protein OCT59_020703 [Rhizophagus irregularis]|uniref:Uncharacterized protein n=1 Tax=Rhizophagus irregularis TaxID=588596 RepID=A0A916EDA1_9GLOM|nr:hypothetical protein OCT59_020703 [Rhizophagus irregularis]CAB5378705.1 unnamed protein product [Rhizophagus irregularis]